MEGANNANDSDPPGTPPQPSVTHTQASAMRSSAAEDRTTSTPSTTGRGVAADSAVGRSLLDFRRLVRDVHEERGGRLRAAQAVQLPFQTLLQLLPATPTPALLFPTVRRPGFYLPHCASRSSAGCLRGRLTPRKP